MGKDSLLLNILKYSVSFVFAFAIIYVLFQHQNPVKLFEEIQGGGDKPAFEYSINDILVRVF